MRFHSAPFYSQRLQSKNRRTNGCEGISISKTLNRFFTFNSSPYLKKNKNEKVRHIRPLHTKYPVKVLKARPRCHFSTFSAVYIMIDMPLPFFLSFFSFLVVVFV